MHSLEFKRIISAFPATASKIHKDQQRSIGKPPTGSISITQEQQISIEFNRDLNFGSGPGEEVHARGRDEDIKNTYCVKVARQWTSNVHCRDTDNF